MALTLTQLQDYINTNVKANGRKAITGDIMNYLMLQFVDWVDTYSALPDKGGHNSEFLRVNSAGTALEWAAVQAPLVSGTNIKTINSTTLLGSGDISVQATLVSGTNIKTLNGTSLLGSGDITISSSNIGNSDLTISSTGARKLKMAGSSGSDSFQIRNSADSASIILARGDGFIGLCSGASGSEVVIYGEYGYLSGFRTWFNGIQFKYGGGGYGSKLELATGFYRTNEAISFLIGTQSSTGGGNGQIIIGNATAPNSSVTDSFQLYSADIIAGNAAPHFRTENGDIVKIYSIGSWGTPTGTLTRTAFDPSTVTLSELGERVAALITDLKTGHQLLKA